MHAASEELGMAARIKQKNKIKFLWVFLPLLATSCSTLPIALEESPFLSLSLWDEEDSKKVGDEKESAPLHTLSSSEHAAAAIRNFSLGQAYSLNNKTDRAIESYRAALVYDPNSPLVHTSLAAELLKKGHNLLEAKSICEKAIALDSSYVDAYLLLAGIHVLSKEYTQSIATYKKVLQISSTNRDALLYYGITLAESGKLEEGEGILKKLVKLEDSLDTQITKAIVWFYLAKVQVQNKKFQAATFSLQQALLENPGFLKAGLFLADTYLALDMEKESIAVLRNVFAEQEDPLIAARLAAYFLSTSKFEESVPYLETVVESDPKNINAKIRLALIYWQLKWHEKSHRLFLSIYEEQPQSNEILFYLGELELERVGGDRAIQYFKKIDPQYSRYEESVHRVVSIYQGMDKIQDAVVFLENSMIARPDLASFYAILGRVYEDKKRLVMAIQVLKRGREEFPDQEDILYYLGYLYDRVGEKKKGFQVMEILLEKNPENVQALNYIGYTLLISRKDMKKAQSYLERAIRLQPNDPHILDSYGWSLFQQGKVEEALIQLELAARMKPGEGIIAEHLAEVYLNLNWRHKALLAYKNALQGMTKGEDQVRVQNKIENISGILGVRMKYEKIRLPASRTCKGVDCL